MSDTWKAPSVDVRDVAARVALDPSTRLLDRLIESLVERDLGSPVPSDAAAAVVTDVIDSLCQALALPHSVAALGALALPPLPGPDSLVAGQSLVAPLLGCGAGLAPPVDDSLRWITAASDAASAAADGADAPGARLEGAALTWTLVAADVLRALAISIDALTDALGSYQQAPVAMLARVAASVASLVSRAPWSTPHTQAAAAAALSAVARCLPSDVGPAPPSCPPEDALRLCLDGRDSFADALLFRCEAEAKGSEWHAAPRLAHVRHAIAASVTALGLKSLTSATRVSSALLLAFRLCDDSASSTSVWLGVSCIAHMLRVTPPTILRATGHSKLIVEVLRRAADCRHPTAVAAVALTQAAARSVLFGPAPALPRPPVHSGSPRFPVLDGPYDDAIASAMHALAIAAASPGRLYALMGGALQPALQQLGPFAARHASGVTSLLAALIHDSGDARVVCAGLSTLRTLVGVVPFCFDVGENEEETGAGEYEAQRANEAVLLSEGRDGRDGEVLNSPIVKPRVKSRAARALIDHVVAAAVVAVVQADAGLVTLPPVQPSGGTSGASSASESPPRDMVQAHADELMRALGACGINTRVYVSSRAHALADEVAKTLPEAPPG